jgi:hypothetical protein
MKKGYQDRKMRAFWPFQVSKMALAQSLAYLL